MNTSFTRIELFMNLLNDAVQNSSQASIRKNEFNIGNTYCTRDFNLYQNMRLTNAVIFLSHESSTFRALIHSSFTRCEFIENSVD